MNYKTIDDMNQSILKNLNILPRDFDLVVGIPRSGMFPASLIALYLNKPITDLGSFINGHIYKSGIRGQFIDTKEFKKILVVDDSIASGSAILKCKDQLKEFEKDFDIKYTVIYTVPDKKDLIDYVFSIVPLPRYFQWNILNHTVLEKSCFDIDGVLCVDPTPEENDDGENYRKFLLNAKPLFIPTAPIATLVSSRLEKYRTETEAWLKKYNIKYKELLMLDLPDMKARQKANCHASFKAEEYKKDKYKLFIESEPHQANEINKITKKPVLCTSNFKMVYNSKSFIYDLKTGDKFPLIHKVLLKIRDKIRK